MLIKDMSDVDNDITEANDSLSHYYPYRDQHFWISTNGMSG